MNIRSSNITTVLIVLVLAAGPMFAQTPADTPTATAAPNAAEVAAMDRIIDQAILRERNLSIDLKNYSPLVETYIQHLERDKDLGAIPTKDRYFLGKLDMTNGVSERSLVA